MYASTNISSVFNSQLELLQATQPDWTHVRSIILLIVGLILSSICVCIFVLLIHRRNYYPVSDRRALLLIAWNLTSIAGIIVSTCSALAYPRGSPCGLSIFLSWIFAPYVVGTLFQGWTLMFRIEIRSYLTEQTWRQYRQRILLANKDNGWTQNNSGDTMNQLFTIPSLEPTSLPGYWSITHRTWMKPHRVVIGLSCISLFAILVMVYVSVINDTDMIKVNDERRSLGMTDLPFTSVFSPTAFFNAPACMSIIKCRKCQIFPIFIIPFLLFVLVVAWRLKVNTNRALGRVAEQSEFESIFACEQDHHRYLYETNDSSIMSTHSIRTDPILLSPSPVLPLHVDATTHESGEQLQHMDIDEVLSMFLELRNGFIVSIIGQTSSIAMGLVSPSWATLSGSLTLFGLLWVFCQGAVRQSYEVSRRQLVLQQKRSNENQPRQDVQHSTPFVQRHPERKYDKATRFQKLSNVLHNSYTYPALVKFLQKEHSSENALFYYEANRFAYFCQTLEKCIRETWRVMTIDDNGTDQFVVDDSPNIGNSEMIKQFQNEKVFGSPGGHYLLLPVAPLSRRAFHEHQLHARKWALQLFIDYIRPNAIYQVNISSDMTRLLTSRHRELEQWQPTPLVSDSRVNELDWMSSNDGSPTCLPSSFDWTLANMYKEAVHAIFKLIESDSFSRFIITKEFQQMVDQYDEDQRTKHRFGRRLQANAIQHPKSDGQTLEEKFESHA